VLIDRHDRLANVSYRLVSGEREAQTPENFRWAV
jgi:hypothetical protein